MKKIIKKRTISIIVVLILIAGGLVAYKKFTAPREESRYILGNATQGTLVVSVSGSGQVSTSQQIDIKPRVSGDISAVSTKAGAYVKRGDILARIDNKDAEKNVRDAQKAIRDAEQALESQKVSLQKLLKPADTLAIIQAEDALAQSKREFADLQKPPETLALLQAENSLLQARESKKNAEDSLEKARGDGMTSVANAFLDLPGVMTGLEDVLFKSTIADNQWNIHWYRDQLRQYNELSASEQYSVTDTAAKRARSAYDSNLESYTRTSRNAKPAVIDAEIMQTYETIRVMTETVKTTRTYVASAKDALTLRNATIPAGLISNQTALDGFTTSANKHLAAVFAAKQNIEDAKKLIESSERSIAEKTESLEKLKRGAEETALQNARERIREREESLKKLQRGPDDLDRKSQEIAITKAQHALEDARERLRDAEDTLSDYTIRAPFDGQIASFDAIVGESASSSSVLGTLVTRDRLAKISLNEVDIAAVRAGQKATLTFDAIPDFSIAGSVVSVDTVGEVSQGVVTFMVTIGFDSADERIKPGMSVSASIITATKDNVLLLPNAAIKSEGESTYVQTADSPQGQTNRRDVQTGLTNDESTEIREGLTEQDTIIMRTIKPGKSLPQEEQRSIFQAPGGSGRGSRRGGAGFRTGR